MYGVLEWKNRVLYNITNNLLILNSDYDFPIPSSLMIHLQISR